MATYRGLAAFTPGVPPGGDSTQYVFGLSFKVTSPNLQLDGWWWYCDIANGQSTDAEDFALWQSTGGTAGIYVTGSKVTSGTFVQGWNFVACSTPIPLTSGQEYVGVKTTNKSHASAVTYSHTAHFFDGAGAGNSGVVNGPLLIFAGELSGTNPEPTGRGQMVFNSGVFDVTANYPANAFNESWYGMDVQVSDVSAPANVSGAVANVAVAAPMGTESVSLTGATANVAVAAPAGNQSVALTGAVANVSVTALNGAASVSLPGPAGSVAVASSAGTVSVSVPGQPSVVTVAAFAGLIRGTSAGSSTLTAAMAAAFNARAAITSQATLEFQAGQPVQPGMTTIASDPWVSMYASTL